MFYRSRTDCPPLNGPGTQSSAAGTPAGAVRAAAGQRHYRSAPVPGRHFNGGSGGTHRVSADKQTEDPEAAGPPAEPRAPGLPLLPAGSGRLQLGPRQAAAGAPDTTWTRTRTRTRTWT